MKFRKQISDNELSVKVPREINSLVAPTLPARQMLSSRLGFTLKSKFKLQSEDANLLIAICQFNELKLDFFPL